MLENQFTPRDNIYSPWCWSIIFSPGNIIYSNLNLNPGGKLNMKFNNIEIIGKLSHHHVRGACNKAKGFVGHAYHHKKNFFKSKSGFIFFLT